MRRRSLFTVGILTSLGTLALGAGLTACEDGPNQTFSPAPPNAGNFWNNGNPDAAVGSGTQEYDAAPSTNITPLNLCSPDLQRQKWAEMLTQPIFPGVPFQQGPADALGFPTYGTTWGTGTGEVSFAGLNVDGTDWNGITFAGAQALLCSAVDLGSSSDGITPTEQTSFGNSQEVIFEYVPQTQVVGQIILSLGYTGAADFYSDPNSKLDPGTIKSPVPGITGLTNHYHIVIGQQIQKNGAPFELNWTDPTITSHMMIYNAQMYFYGSQQGVYLGHDDPQSCEDDQSCLFYPPAFAPSNNDLCIFGIRPLLTYWETYCQVQLQPTVSQIAQMYFDFGKVMPFSHLAQDLRISNVGPSTHQRQPASAYQNDPPNCNQYLGLDFGTFLQNCGHVNVTGATPVEVPIVANAAKDVYFAKLTGGHTHNVQSVFFNVVGINMSWDDENPAIVGINSKVPQAIVQDTYLPCTGSASNPTMGEPSCTGNPDLATDWEFDVRTDALPDNDNSTVQGGSPYRGTGLVQREWATLVQADMNSILQANPIPGVNPALYTHQIGDAACRVPPAQAQALGCTGFEGYAIAGSPDPADNCTGSPPFGNICDNILVAGAYAEAEYGGYGSSSLTPGDPTSYFCQDPSQATSDTGGCVDGAVWTNALNTVTDIVALGNPALLPWELKDRRFYFRWWGIAMIKYYMAYGANPTPYGTAGFLTWANVDAQNLDLTSLFFDNDFAASFDKDEYMVRGNALPGGVAVQQSTPITGSTPGGTVTVPATVGGNGTLLGPAALPMDYTYGSDTIAANQRYTNWYKRMDREEAAMFEAMQVDKADLYGSENTVNITNLAGSPILAANYASYECATQWPNVTIAALGITAQPWPDVCAEACPALATLPGLCPNPPGVGTSGNGIPTGDQNGTPAWPGIGVPTAVPALAGGLVAPQARLAAYPSIWGGTGSFCVGSGDGVEGDSYSQDPTVGNPFQNPACQPSEPTGAPPTFSMTANLHGSVFKVAGSDPNGARIQFLTPTGTPQTTLPTGNMETLEAFVSIPNMANPYNNNKHVGKLCAGATVSDCIQPGANGAAPLTGAQAINVSVPWTPSLENVGFQIPISGTTQKFVQTAQLDFTGVLETYIVDYEPWIYNPSDPTKSFNAGGTAYDGTIKIDGIEGNDFLGEVFLCQDNGSIGTASGDFIGTQDLLGVHMYDTGGEVLQWLTQHPGLQNSCGIIVQYSEYNNYLNYIASLTGGITVGISQGSGYGRITSVIAFDPLIAQIP
jgi:hypothetical protein